MELEVQKWLRTHTLSELETAFAIKVRRHNKYKNLVCLKYNQIESPFGERIVQECRGIILDQDRDWAVVSRTFDKFFNYGEGHAAHIYWDSARVQEKLDGSLMQVYFYDGRWNVASSGTPDASGTLICVQQEGEGTFEKLFWDTWSQLGYDTKWLDPEFTYGFELMTPFNRVVIPHTKRRIALICVRHVESGQESRPPIDIGFETPNEFNLFSFEDCIESFQHINPLSQEGYVVVDSYFHRVKMKHPGYVALAHLKDGLGPRRVLEIIRSGETSEVVVHFPEWRPIFESIQAKYDSLVGGVEEAWNRLKGMPVGGAAEQKAFALEAVKTKYPSALFELRRGNVSSIREYFARVHIKHLMDALHVKDAEVIE